MKGDPNRQRLNILPTQAWQTAILLLFLACGFGTRLYDLTDPPLDYAPSRQLRSAIIARDIYYQQAAEADDWQRQVAAKQSASQEMLEPKIMEHLTGWSYLLLGGEYLWIARIYSSLFWTLGGLALYLLMREQLDSTAAIIGLLFYLFDPFALLAGRTFQPDPLMTALIVLSWFYFLKWREERSTRWAWAAGLSVGAAVFVKSSAVFFLFFGMAAVLLLEVRLRELIKDPQVWLVGGLAILPALIYHFYGFMITGDLRGQLAGRLFNPSMWNDKSFYVGWATTAGKVLGHWTILILAVLSSFLVKKRRLRIFVLGTWVGFVVYGFAVSYYVTTHSYYLLPIIPLAAITLGASVGSLISALDRPLVTWMARLGVAAGLVLGVAGGYFLYHREDFRHEPGYYQKVASYVSHSERVIALSQDYGFRLAYYGWIVVHPYQGIEKTLIDQQDIDGDGIEMDLFEQMMDKYDVFIITRMEDFREDPFLSEALDNHYQIRKRGGGYLIYDLKERLE